jgi:hypothetical protein
MHIGLLREVRLCSGQATDRRVSYDLLTTRRFRLTGHKIACVITPGLCASPHCQKFLKVMDLAALAGNTCHKIPYLLKNFADETIACVLSCLQRLAQEANK